MLNRASATSSRWGGNAATRRAFRRWPVVRGVLLLLLVVGLAASIPTVFAAPGHQDGTQPPPGDSVTGKNIFTGALSLQNGGPDCQTCHSVSGIGGALGGGVLGPSLTGAYAKLGDAMMVWPESVQPMMAIYEQNRLTDDEKAHLLAFFTTAAVTERAPEAVYQLGGLAAIGTALTLGLVHLMWIRRLRSVRRKMVGHRALGGS